ncbi:MAG: hypothetical protein J6S92_04720 [Oscillospiraceae bacterium]|nr:hypothetical protein [Oscillospiraceae bacterium]MBQ9906263.1 hypothetical protein [Oscillospiraceae bacterium]
MNHLKKGICGIIVLTLCAGMLTGCGNKPETAETESKPAASESAAAPAETDAAAESLSEAQESADEAAAKEKLTAFLEGCRNHDLDAILSVADYSGLYQALEGDAFDEAQFRQELEAMLCDSFESYSVGELTSSYQDLVTFNGNVSSFLKEMEEEPAVPDDEETLRLIGYAKQTMKPADNRCAFAVTVNAGGTETTDDLVMLRCGDTWQLDLVTETATRIYQNRVYNAGQQQE